MSALTDKINELAQAAQRFEEAQNVIQVLREAARFAHQEVKDLLEGNAPATQPTPEPVQQEAQPEPAPTE